LPCPYYRAGACNSPKLGEPSDSVVSAQRCGGPPEFYRGCSLYIEIVGIDKPAGHINNERGGVRVITRSSIASRIYAPIHILKEPVFSECPHYKIETVSGGYVALCNTLRRPLTKYETRLCSLYWRDCPYITLPAIRSGS